MGKKEVKAKLYSNFVKSGTLTGGKMEETEEGDSGFVEDKDLSLLRTLTDDELVKACGGRTAHKGGRHGHRMNAKLARIEKAEAEYMLNHKSKKEAAAALAEERVGARLVGEGDNGGRGKETELTEDLAEVKRKKKKRKKEKDSDDGIIEPENKTFKGGDKSEITASIPVELNQEPRHKKKKSKKRKDDIENVEPQEEIKNEEPQEEIGVPKKKKSKKSKKSDETLISEEVSLKKKKSKRKKLKGGSD